MNAISSAITSLLNLNKLLVLGLSAVLTVSSSAVGSLDGQIRVPSTARLTAKRTAVAENPLRSRVVRGGVYYSKDEVAAYIFAYGCLPTNFITKAEARRLGWRGGPLERYAPGKAIGGDRFGNYERKLPFGQYRECDIDTLRRPRGAKRIVFTADRRLYYTDDHYRTFRKIENK